MKNVTFLISIKGKNKIWIDLSWLIEKIIGGLNKCNYWALDPKWTLDNISLTTEHSNDILNSYGLFGFTCWQLKISANLKKNVIKEANWVGGPLLMSHPIGYQF